MQYAIHYDHHYQRKRYCYYIAYMHHSLQTLIVLVAVFCAVSSCTVNVQGITSKTSSIRVIQRKKTHKTKNNTCTRQKTCMCILLFRTQSCATLFFRNNSTSLIPLSYIHLSSTNNTIPVTDKQLLSASVQCSDIGHHDLGKRLSGSHSRWRLLGGKHPC